MRFRREKQEIIQIFVGLALLILCCDLLAMNVRRLRADLAAGDAAGMRIEAVFLAIGIACIVYFIWFIATAYRTYSVDAEGITVHGLFGLKRRAAWAEYPYRYLLWGKNPKGVLSRHIVFSKEEIQEKPGKKQAFWPSRPRAAIHFLHTPEREAAIRAQLPACTFEVRNGFLVQNRKP